MRLLVLASAILLTSCAGSGPFGRSADDYVADGSLITLNEPITIRRNAVAAPLRGGAIGTPQEFEGHCRLELWTISSKERLVEPDTFTVQRTNWRREYFGGFHPLNTYAGILTSEGPNLFWYETYVYLNSDRQPDVFRLRCRHLQQGERDPRYLTVAQMQTILGGVMTLDDTSASASASIQ